jgi:signal transduction histidine kinase
MHLYVLIPLVACVGACAMASVVLARDPTARRSRIAAGILACAAIWSLCDLLAHVLMNPAVALSLIRVSILPVLALPPLALQLVLEENEALRQRYSRALFPIWLCLGLSVPASLFSPALISGVVWTHWGWMAQLGPAYFWGFVPVTVCVIVAFLAFRTQSRLMTRMELREGRVFAWIATLLLAMIPATEVVTPLLEIAAPRLGALTVTVLGAILWFLSLNLGEYVPPPSAFAREMLDTLSDGVALINRAGTIRSANPAFDRLALIPPDNRRDVSVSERLGISLEELPDGGAEFETTLHRGDGSTIPVSATRSDLRDVDGSKLGSVLVIRDLREVAKLRRRLVAAGRLAAVGELAAGIVHEVNNPIEFIKSNLNSLHKNDASIMDILRRELAPAELPEALREGHHLIGQSLQGIARVASIVKEVRGFSHMGPTGQQMNDVNALIEDVVRIALPQLRASATLVREYGELPSIECAGQDIKQVLLDLILNAASSLGGSGTIRLCTARDGDMISIVVEDDGRGHSQKQVERIFDPMPGGAVTESGLDLCVAEQIVRQHEGEIRMESGLGQGSTVTVRLPIVGTESVSLEGEADDAVASRGEPA